MATALLPAGAGAAAAAVAPAGSVTVVEDGTVLDGREVNGYVHVKANNVRIRNMTIRYDGNYALRIFDGFSGTVIEDTDITCTAEKTNGVVFGNYRATRVRVTGCLTGFSYSPAVPATITDSTWNGAPISATPASEPSPATARPGPVPSPTPTATVPPPTAATSPGAIPAGYPGAGTTGVPAGTRLTASGPVFAGTDGQVIDGLAIEGCVTVAARKVTIRNSRISCGDNYSIRTLGGAVGLLVEDVEIDGLGRNSAAVCCGDYTLRRVEISNVIDGPRLGNNTVVEDSWIHHLARVGSSHNDTLQTTGAVNVLVRGNSLEPYNPVTRDPMNACLMIGSTTAPLVANLTFEGNYCNGGNYSIGVQTALIGSAISFADNVFGHDCRFGIIARPSQLGLSWERASNVWADSRESVLG